MGLQFTCHVRKGNHFLSSQFIYESSRISSQGNFCRVWTPVSTGRVAESPDEAVAAAREISEITGQESWVIKVQVHAGGRGKAGGVKLVHSVDEIRDFAGHWIGNRLVTVQTGEGGQPVDRVYIEELTDIDRELYLGAVIDRAQQRIVFMASTEGRRGDRSRCGEYARTHIEDRHRSLGGRTTLAGPGSRIQTGP